MASNEDNKALGIKAPELKAVPHEMYPGYGDMNYRLNQLQEHNENQMNMVNGMTSGQIGGDARRRHNCSCSTI